MIGTEARRHHLTDQEFSDLLCGEQPNTAIALHLASCDHCRHELEVVGVSLGSFRELGTAWAQAKAPGLVAIPSRWARRLVSIPSWGTGLAVSTAAGLVAFALGLPSGPAPAPGIPAAAAATQKADLAEDNRLMLSIDQELSYQAPTPLGASHAEERHGLRHTADATLD